jgi:hypothetical protein
MTDFPNENILADVVESFAETVALKVKQLRRYIPKKKAKTNSELTGTFIEEVVREFVSAWIGHHILLSGTFYSKKEKESGEKAMQIDGILYDPTKGPTILREGNFGLVHPAFCAGVIEIKMTFTCYETEYPGLLKLEERLTEINQRYLPHLPSSHVMGIVIADDDPAKVSVSQFLDVNKNPVLYHDHNTVPLRPIFVLFKHTDGEYEPEMQAIENMIRAIHHLRIGTTYV